MLLLALNREICISEIVNNARLICDMPINHNRQVQVGNYLLILAGTFCRLEPYMNDVSQES